MDEETALAPAIQKVSYTHDAMIDLLIANPAIKQGDLARHFGYTQAWVSRVMSSDAFKERMIARKHELVDPGITNTIEENLEALARQSLAVLQEKLEAAPNPEVALKALEISSKALGYGARGQTSGVTVNTYVALMPQKSQDSSSWLRDHSPDVLEVASLIDEPQRALPSEPKVVEPSEIPLGRDPKQPAE